MPRIHIHNFIWGFSRLSYFNNLRFKKICSRGATLTSSAIFNFQFNWSIRRCSKDNGLGRSKYSRLNRISRFQRLKRISWFSRWRSRFDGFILVFLVNLLSNITWFWKNTVLTFQVHRQSLVITETFLTNITAFSQWQLQAQLKASSLLLHFHGV